MRRLLLLGVTVLALGACSSDDETPVTPSPSSAPSTSVATPTSTTGGGGGGSPTTEGGSLGGIYGPAQVDMTTTAP